MIYFSIVRKLPRVYKHLIPFIKTRFARVNSDDHQHIGLLCPQILVLKLTGTGDPNSIFYVLSDETTLVYFLIMCKFYNSVKNCLFRPFPVKNFLWAW